MIAGQAGRVGAAAPRGTAAPGLVIAGSSARGILGFRHRRRFPKNFICYMT
jgi:hypothetical protein